jgi:hypothetical protein
MKNTLNSVAFSLLFIIITSFQSDNNVIIWSKERKLTWKDFQGKVSNDKTYEVVNIYKENERDAARSRTSIALYFECKGNIANHLVRAEFEKNNSWYYASRISDDVLRHEQLHFDITELFARNLKEKLMSLKNPCDKSSVSIEYQSNEKAFVEFTKQYDNETSHGVNLKTQAIWDAKVQNLISAFK